MPICDVAPESTLPPPTVIEEIGTGRVSLIILPHLIADLDARRTSAHERCLEAVDESNPFMRYPDHLAVGVGELVIDQYLDGEVIAQTLVRGSVMHPLRPGQGYALRVLLERRGEVVGHNELMRPGTSRDTLRRDLGHLRELLKDVDADLEIVRGSGYRLRDASAPEPEVVTIGDCIFDADARVLQHGEQRVVLGEIAARVLMLLADKRSHETLDVYRHGWPNTHPHEVADIVAAQIANLRKALESLGSSVEILTLIEYTWGRATTRYHLCIPSAKRSTCADDRPSCPVQTLPQFGLEPTQLALFEAPAVPGRARRVGTATPDAKPLTAEQIPLPF